MTIFRSLKTMITRQRNNPRPFLTSLYFASPTLQPPCPTPAATLLPFSTQPSFLFRSRFLAQPRFLSPLSRFIIFPFHGPLFLSSPPWKLSQSATPLYIQGDVVLPAKIEALKLIQRTKAKFPLKLGFRTKDDLKKEGGAVVSVISKHSSDILSGFWNLPNLVSISRIVSGPVLGWMIINEWYLPAFVGLAISGATDWLDGFLARKMGINSVIGSYLDPLADKVLIGCVAIAMVENNLLHPGLVGLVVMRDVLLVGGAVYKRASDLGWQWKHWSDFVNLDGTRPVKVEPLVISKINTVLQLLLVATALLQPELGTPETQPYITYLSWLVVSTTLASTAGYGAQYMRSKSMSVSRR